MTLLKARAIQTLRDRSRKGVAAGKVDALQVPLVKVKRELSECETPPPKRQRVVKTPDIKPKIEVKVKLEKGVPGVASAGKDRNQRKEPLKVASVKVAVKQEKRQQVARKALPATQKVKKTQVKQDNKKTPVKQEQGARRISVKTEEEQQQLPTFAQLCRGGLSTTGPGEPNEQRKVKLEAGLGEPPEDFLTRSYALLLPLWKKQCTDFQKREKHWSALTPCCLPSVLMDTRGPPPGDGTCCFDRMSRSRRKSFRTFIESGRVIKKLGPGTPYYRSFKHLLFPRGAKELSSSSGTSSTAETQLYPMAPPQPKSAKVDADPQVDPPAAIMNMPSNCEELERELRRMARARKCTYYGVNYSFSTKKWVATWYEKDRGQRMAYFRPGRFRKQGMKQLDALTEALRAAIQCRLRQAGSLQRLTTPIRKVDRLSGVQGMSWKTSHKCWVAQRRVAGRWLWCKYFKPREMTEVEIERARKLGVEFLKKQEGAHPVLKKERVLKSLTT